MRAIKVAGLAMVLTVVTVGALAAQRGVDGLGAIVLRDSALDRVAERLEFSDDQRDELRVLAENYRNENADVLDRVERMREELQALRDGDEQPTRQELAEVVERYDHPDLDIERAQRRLDRDVRAILTLEQETILTRGMRLRAQDSRSRMSARRAVQPRGARRARVEMRRPGIRHRRAPVSRMRQARRRPPRPERP
jgi:hypothetical protein